MQLQANPVLEEWTQEIARTGHFAVNLTPPSIRWHYDVFSKLPAHDKVLRPVLARAKECLVYGISSDSRIHKASSSILQADKRRYRFILSGDPVTSHELLWNAHGGERGSIVIMTDRQSLCAEEIFPHCYFPHVCGNTGAGHTQSAIRFARKAANQSDSVALLLPRNNGLEWMDIFAAPTLAVELFELAWRLQKKGEK